MHSKGFLHHDIQITSHFSVQSTTAEAMPDKPASATKGRSGLFPHFQSLISTLLLCARLAPHPSQPSDLLISSPHYPHNVHTSHNLYRREHGYRQYHHRHLPTAS